MCVEAFFMELRYVFAWKNTSQTKQLKDIWKYVNIVVEIYLPLWDVVFHENTSTIKQKFYLVELIVQLEVWLLQEGNIEGLSTCFYLDTAILKSSVGVLSET